MIKNNINNPKNSVNFLSKKLHEGGELFRTLKTKYDRLMNAPWIIAYLLSYDNFSGIKQDCDNWSKSILDYLEENFPNSVYSHQFKTPPQEINPNSKDGWRTKYLKNFQGQIRQLEKIIYALKEEVVLQSKNTKSQLANDALYVLSYDTHSHEIMMNGLKIAKFRSFSENDQIIEYLINHSNKKIEISEIESALRIKLSKTPAKIATDLGFSGNLRKVFFPSNSKTSIMLKNPISHQYAVEHKLPRLEVT